MCPYNRTTPEPLDAAFEPHPRLREVDLPGLLRMEEEAFLLWSEGSPMRRSGIARLARNAAVVLGNVGTRVHLPVLQEASLSHPSDTVREAARWALGEIEGREGHPGGGGSQPASSSSSD